MKMSEHYDQMARLDSQENLERDARPLGHYSLRGQKLAHAAAKRELTRRAKALAWARSVARGEG